jgi:heme o synthase
VWALTLVIFQGVLGGITVLYRLPSLVSTAHLGTSMIFLGLLFYLNILHNFSVSTWWISWRRGLSAAHKIKISRASLLLLAGFYGQVLWGAYMRHSGFGGACGQGWSNAFLCQDMISSTPVSFPNTIEAWVHYGHRLMGILLAGYLIYFVRLLPAHWPVGRLFLIGIILQIGLGFWTVASAISPIPTTLHLLVAALLWLLALLVFFVSKETGDNLITFWRQRLLDYVSLMKPRLSSLVLLTAYLGVAVAQKSGFSSGQFLWLLMGTTLTVAGACALNCYWERNLDALMLRTAQRCLPAKRVAAVEALVLGCVTLSLGLLVLAWKSNLLTFYLGLFAALSYVLVYTPLKTRSPLAVFVGAIPGAIPPLMGYTGVTGEIGFPGVLLFLLLFFWQIPHFLSISIRYAEEYKRAGIRIYPNVLGLRPTQWRMFGFCMLIVLLSVVPHWLDQPWASLSYLLGSCFLALLFLMLGQALELMHATDCRL